MPWCDAGDLVSWAEQNELCFGLEFVLQHEYNSHLKLCKAELVNCQKCNNSIYPLPAAALYALICGVYVAGGKQHGVAFASGGD